ncbi:Homeobox-leucine zipper protein HAT22 [Cucurbita argyrosperma subsp. argyrosperma]|nr:Homeobox-leucine zipper protein HAT22 [Cucurbita argyrosperma subsp. argyrosperma]
MGLDDVSQTSLVLGLGISEAASPIINNLKNNKKKKNNKNPTSLEFEPCALTLGFSGDVDPPRHHPHHHHHLYRQASPHSSAVCSSFSGGGGGGIKRERDLSSEEVELERVCCRVSDEDEDGCNTRKKLRLSKQQSALLEESFKQNSTLNPKQKQTLARHLNLRPRQVEVWFQNRRARTKMKQTEVDCEFLKKCCETLTNENRRLQKELQELKALKLAHPLYMHMPAATLTMCPSCERVGGVGVGVGDGASKPKFSMAPKPHFYNPFSNPSAAC